MSGLCTVTLMKLWDWGKVCVHGFVCWLLVCLCVWQGWGEGAAGHSSASSIGAHAGCRLRCTGTHEARACLTSSHRQGVHAAVARSTHVRDMPVGRLHALCSNVTPRTK